jgi:hypothetical protein
MLPQQRDSRKKASWPHLADDHRAWELEKHIRGEEYEEDDRLLGDESLPSILHLSDTYIT